MFPSVFVSDIMAPWELLLPNVSLANKFESGQVDSRDFACTKFAVLRRRWQQADPGA